MRRSFALLGLPTTALAVGSRAQDPCAAIAGKTWVKPSQVNACLSYFPFNTTLRDNVVDVVSKTFQQFHTSTSFHLNMPDPFTDDTVDLIRELNRIKSTTYKSDYLPVSSVAQQVKRLGDGHAGYLNYCYDSIYVTYLPFPIAVLANPNAPDVQNIYIVPEASEVVTSAFKGDAIKQWQSALGRNLTAFDGARITSINGQDPWTYIDNLAAHSGSFQARTTRQNGFFASYQGYSYRLGGFAQLSLPPQNDTISLSIIRNGTTTQETYNVPYLSQLGSDETAFTDAKSFWTNNCRPTRSTNGSPNDRASSSSSSSSDASKSKLLATEDPYSRPARFQSDPIKPQTEGGRRLGVSSLVNDGPTDIELPASLTPPPGVWSVGPMNWYMLDDGKTAVLQLSSFSGRFLSLQKGVLDGISKVQAKGATRLLIDLSNNGGGIICLAAWLHRVLAGPQPGLDVQPGLNGSVRAQDLPQKIVAKIISNSSMDPEGTSYYNPTEWKGTDGKTFASNFNWLNPPIGVQVNGVADKFSQRIGDTCLPFSLTPPSTQPFKFENIAIMSNGRCASSCSLFSTTMAIEYNVKTVVVGGRPGTTQQYCGVVGGQSLNFVTMDSEVKTVGLKNDPLAPPDFLTNSYQGITWKLGWSIRDPNTFEEFNSHPAQFNFPLLPSTVNRPAALWKDVSKRLWPN
ncbi:peptidase family S41 protein [Ceratobasidium sp. AG-Ba]|nr:peptidase family S41 protein [Ceratobasidium sp. AG-Ba]